MDIRTLNDAEVSRLKEILAFSRHIVICCHKSPDGDAVGSSLAWKHYLTSLNERRSAQLQSSEIVDPQEDFSISVVLPDAAPDFLHWMPGFDKVLRYDKKPEVVKQVFDEADLVCCMDFNSSSRTEAMQTLLDECEAPKLLIDHHLYPDVKTLMSISRTDMSSTCELVFNLIWQLGDYPRITKQIATCLYAGMMTDTGSFTYNSSRPEIFFIISQLLAVGINKDKIYNKVYHQNSIDSMRLRGFIVFAKMKVVKNLHASYFIITRQDMKRFRFQKGDAEGLVNEPLRIKNMRLSISLREDTEKDNLVHVSLRSSCGFHCEQVARKFFNGGGHENAAGGRLICPIEEAEQITLKAILAYQEQLK